MASRAAWRERPLRRSCAGWSRTPARRAAGRGCSAPRIRTPRAPKRGRGAAPKGGLRAAFARPCRRTARPQRARRRRAPRSRAPRHGRVCRGLRSPSVCRASAARRPPSPRRRPGTRGPPRPAPAGRGARPAYPRRAPRRRTRLSGVSRSAAASRSATASTEARGAKGAAAPRVSRCQGLPARAQGEQGAAGDEERGRPSEHGPAAAAGKGARSREQQEDAGERERGFAALPGAPHALLESGQVRGDRLDRRIGGHEGESRRLGIEVPTADGEIAPGAGLGDV